MFNSFYKQQYNILINETFDKLQAIHHNLTIQKGNQKSTTSVGGSTGYFSDLPESYGQMLTFQDEMNLRLYIFLSPY